MLITRDALSLYKPYSLDITPWIQEALILALSEKNNLEYMDKLEKMSPDIAQFPIDLQNTESGKKLYDQAKDYLDLLYNLASKMSTGEISTQEAIQEANLLRRRNQNIALSNNAIKVKNSFVLALNSDNENWITHPAADADIREFIYNTYKPGAISKKEFQSQIVKYVSGISKSTTTLKKLLPGEPGYIPGMDTIIKTKGITGDTLPYFNDMWDLLNKLYKIDSLPLNVQNEMLDLATYNFANLINSNLYIQYLNSKDLQTKLYEKDLMSTVADRHKKTSGSGSGGRKLSKKEGRIKKVKNLIKNGEHKADGGILHGDGDEIEKRRQELTDSIASKLPYTNLSDGYGTFNEFKSDLKDVIGLLKMPSTNEEWIELLSSDPRYEDALKVFKGFDGSAKLEYDDAIRKQVNDILEKEFGLIKNNNIDESYRLSIDLIPSHRDYYNMEPLYLNMQYAVIGGNNDTSEISDYYKYVGGNGARNISGQTDFLGDLTEADYNSMIENNGKDYDKTGNSGIVRQTVAPETWWSGGGRGYSDFANHMRYMNGIGSIVMPSLVKRVTGSEYADTKIPLIDVVPKKGLEGKDLISDMNVDFVWGIGDYANDFLPFDWGDMQSNKKVFDYFNDKNNRDYFDLNNRGLMAGANPWFSTRHGKEVGYNWNLFFNTGDYNRFNFESYDKDDSDSRITNDMKYYIRVNANGYNGINGNKLHDSKYNYLADPDELYRNLLNKFYLTMFENFNNEGLITDAMLNSCKQKIYKYIDNSIHHKNTSADVNSIKETINGIITSASEKNRLIFNSIVNETSREANDICLRYAIEYARWLDMGLGGIRYKDGKVSIDKKSSRIDNDALKVAMIELGQYEANKTKLSDTKVLKHLNFGEMKLGDGIKIQSLQFAQNLSPSDNKNIGYTQYLSDEAAKINEKLRTLLSDVLNHPSLYPERLIKFVLPEESSDGNSKQGFIDRHKDDFVGAVFRPNLNKGVGSIYSARSLLTGLSSELVSNNWSLIAKEAVHSGLNKDKAVPEPTGNNYIYLNAGLIAMEYEVPLAEIDDDGDNTEKSSGKCATIYLYMPIGDIVSEFTDKATGEVINQLALNWRVLKSHANQNDIVPGNKEKLTYRDCANMIENYITDVMLSYFSNSSDFDDYSKLQK